MPHSSKQPSPSFLTRVRESIPDLHPTEKRLAEFVLDFPGELESYAASELARLAGQGAEGMRFMGYTVFEALISYDLSSADKPVTLIPGLAAEWQVDPADKTRWTFKLRPGVKFHDGSGFNAQAVVWNLDKILKQDAEQYDARQAAQGRGRIPSVKSYKAIDELTVEIVTAEPDALLLNQLAWIVMSSPAQWNAVGKSWDAFLQKPSGTGPWQLQNYTPRERAVLVRKAANLAIDRDGMQSLLGGMMVPAKGMVPPNSPWFGSPTFEVKYDPAAAQALMAEAGYSKDKPLKIRSIISPSGGGQMQPLLMNELIQQNLAAIGIEVEFDVRDWNGLLANWRAGAKDPGTNGASTTNSSYFSQDPFTALMRHVDSRLMPPKGTNWGYYSDPAMDTLFDGIRTAFDPTEQLALIQKVHEKYVDEALFLFVAHDVAPRAMSPRVKGFVQAQNWFQDFSRITIE